MFSSLTTYYMCCLSLPMIVVDQINKYLRHCLWRKFGSGGNGTTLIAYNKVCKPKTHGGLGILDISTHNKALLIIIHMFYNKVDLLPVKLIWETYYTNPPPSW